MRSVQKAEYLMPSATLGVKHTCFKCSTKFYDLDRPEPICPSCGTDQREDPAPDAPPVRRKREPEPRSRPAPILDEPEEESEEDSEDGFLDSSDDELIGAIDDEDDFGDAIVEDDKDKSDDDDDDFLD